MDTRNQLCCPHCGSTDLNAGKKGFSAGKFVAGTILFNPLAGVLAGGWGANDPEVYCLRCGKKFKPGGINGLTTVREYKRKKTFEEKLRKSGEDKEYGANGCAVLLVIIAFCAVFAGNLMFTIICGTVGIFLFFLASKMKKQRLQREEKLRQENERKMYEQQLLEKQQARLQKIEEIKKKFIAICPECNSEIRGDMKFCPGCGMKVAMDGTFICPNCENEMSDPSADFCSNCGVNVTAFQEVDTNSWNDSAVQSQYENAQKQTFYSTSNTMAEEKSNVPSPDLKAGFGLFIAAFYLPYLFLFSKFKNVKIFARIWFAIVLLISIIAICNSNGNTEKEKSTKKSSQKISVSKKSVKKLSVKKPSVVQENTNADIRLFSQLPIHIQRNLKEIGIYECFGTTLHRRVDLEDSMEMRCYRIRKCSKLPENVADTVHLYMKNNSLYMVTYFGRTILGAGVKIHIKQAVVDFYCKYKADKLYEIKELLQEGWRPSLM